MDEGCELGDVEMLGVSVGCEEGPLDILGLMEG